MPRHEVSIHVDAENPAALAGHAATISGEAQDWVDDMAKKVETTIANRPALALGTALAAGVFLGWLIKRR